MSQTLCTPLGNVILPDDAHREAAPRPMRWTVELLPDHLFVRAEGQFHLATTRGMIGEIARICHRRGYARVLCDMRSVGGSFSSEDRYLAGVQIAEQLQTIQLAVAGAPGYVTQFGMNVANRRGASVLATTDIEQARRWLFS